MSDDQPQRRYRVEVIPTVRACVVEVEAVDADQAILHAQDMLDVHALTEGATWEVREVGA